MLCRANLAIGFVLLTAGSYNGCSYDSDLRELFGPARHYGIEYRNGWLQQERARVTISDEALMLDFQRGSREAFEELYARYRGPLYGFFRRRLDDAGGARAEDLAQETFLAVIRAIGRYRPQALAKTYFYAIALNLLAAERRKRPQGSIEDSALEPAGEDRSVTALWVRAALKELAPTEREILMLREFEQLSYAEISDLLRIPVNTVRSRLFRARMALKERLQPDLKRERPSPGRKSEFPALSSQSEGEEESR